MKTGRARSARLPRILASAAAVLLAAGLASGEAQAGPLHVDPSNRRWLYKDGVPFFWCGPGDPEDFLHRGSRQANGTRTGGDQAQIIQNVIGTGANSAWMTAIRSHGGDGGPTENPFVNSDPSQGVSAAVLTQWNAWIEASDAQEIVTFFVFYDDGSLVWNTGGTVGPAEANFVAAIVNRFEHVDHLVWCIAEEFEESYSTTRVSALAALIAQVDDRDHPITTHQLPSTVCAFPNDPHQDAFSMQAGAGETPGSLHAKVVQAWQNAAGNYNVTMAEAVGHYTDRTSARKMSWAAAMGGSYVMVQAMDVIDTPVAALQDCGRLASFFRSTPFHRFAPSDASKRGQTEYVFGAPSAGYIAYASNATGSLGLSVPGSAAGSYDLRWFDCIAGVTVVQSGVQLHAGDNTWPKPPGIGPEVALSIEPAGATGVDSAVDSASWGRIKSLFRN